MKRLYLLFALLIISTVLLSEEVSPNQGNPKHNLSSPYFSVMTFYKYMQKDTYRPDIAARVFERTRIGSEEAVEYAVKLKRALDGKGILIKVEEVPRDTNYFDSLSHKNIYILTTQHPSIYLEKKGKNWLFPNEVLSEIDYFYGQVFPFGTDKLLGFLPKLGEKKYVGLYLWQLIAILLLILFSFLLHKLFSYLIERFIFRAIKKMGYEGLAKDYFIPIAKPISILIISVLLILFLPILQLPVKASYYINIIIKALLPFFVTIVFYKMVDVFSLYLEKLAGKTETSLDDQLVPLIRKVLKVFVIAIGSLFILQNLNINITALLAGLSIGGLAFALAAQDTIKNFFGSVMIFLDRPFQIGHWISTGDINGTVEEVGFRSTRVRTFTNSLTYIPNGKLADMTIDNHGLRQYRRFSTTITITYDTPPKIIKLFINGLNQLVEAHPHTRKDFYIVRLNDFGASSLNIMFYIFFEVPTWEEELACREEIILSIIKMADSLNVRFAFPTQTLHMETFPEKTALTPKHEEDVEFYKKRVKEFFEKDGEQK